MWRYHCSVGQERGMCLTKPPTHLYIAKRILLSTVLLSSDLPKSCKYLYVPNIPSARYKDPVTMVTPSFERLRCESKLTISQTLEFKTLSIGIFRTVHIVTSCIHSVHCYLLVYVQHVCRSSKYLPLQLIALAIGTGVICTCKLALCFQRSVYGLWWFLTQATSELSIRLYHNGCAWSFRSKLHVLFSQLRGAQDKPASTSWEKTNMWPRERNVKRNTTPVTSSVYVHIAQMHRVNVVQIQSDIPGQMKSYRVALGRKRWSSSTRPSHASVMSICYNIWW